MDKKEKYLKHLKSHLMYSQTKRQILTPIELNDASNIYIEVKENGWSEYW